MKRTRNIKFIFSLILLLLGNFVLAQITDQNIKGVWISSSQFRIWEFDDTNNLLYLSNYKNEKQVEKFNYIFQSEILQIYNNDSLLFQIIPSFENNNMMQLSYLDSSNFVIDQLYKIDFYENNLSELENIFINQTIVIDNSRPLFLRKNKLVYLLQHKKIEHNSVFYYEEKRWNINSLFRFATLNFDDNIYLVLDKTSNGLKLGNISNGFEINNLEFIKKEVSPIVTKGSWSFNDTIPIPVDIRVQKTKKLKINNKKAVIKGCCIQNSKYKKNVDIRRTEEPNVIELFLDGNLFSAFQISQFDGKTRLKEILIYNVNYFDKPSKHEEGIPGLQ